MTPQTNTVDWSGLLAFALVLGVFLFALVTLVRLQRDVRRLRDEVDRSRK